MTTPLADSVAAHEPDSVAAHEPNSVPAHEPNANWYGRLGVEPVLAEGVWVTTADERELLDCLAAAGTMTLGHRHPDVTEAAIEFLKSGAPLQTLDFNTPIRRAFVAQLLATLPEPLRTDGRVLLCSPSGNDAIEAAIKLAKIAKAPRRAVLSFRGAYHGMGHAALALTGWVEPKAALPGLMPDVYPQPFPDGFRDPFGLGLGIARSAETSANYIEDLLCDSDSGIPPVAAMLVEVVQGEGGQRPAPHSWLRSMREVTERHGILLIVDEVQTGMGRTGTLWACQQAGIVPDVLVAAKGIGGGFPLAVVVYRGELDRWGPGAHSGTFEGNQLAMVTGTTALRITIKEQLPAHAALMGQRLMDGLRQLQAAHPMVGEVRGRGLMVGIDIVDPAHPRDYDGRASTAEGLAGRLQMACLDEGLIVDAGGRDCTVIRLLPPLIITEEQVDLIVDRVAAALQRVKAG
jgi:diaminobutyrate-2-oxoglutarate transaminase